MALVSAAVQRLGAPYLMFNQRNVASTSVEFAVTGGRVGGSLITDGRTCDLADISAVYVRLMDDTMLPEVEEQPPGSPVRVRSRRVHDVLMRWTETAPVRVVNRYSAMASNGSKPYQAQLISRFGFSTPETLITNDPAHALSFWEHHGRVIYKSVSGVRSIVKELDRDDLDRLEMLRWCPTQFQAFVPGRNVRVHVVGDEVFATGITSEAVDYRYAHQQVGESADLSPVELRRDVADRCIALAGSLGLDLAGIDLKITPEGEVFCFEVNPSPAFSYYESNTGQGISDAIARHLAAV
jgi:glutathione synthase/RimK-type ligase-like ATP-grasp enzyme